MNKSVLLLLLMPTLAHAVEPYVKYGLGLNSDITNVKVIAAGVETPAFGFFNYQFEGGAYYDNTQTQGLIGFSSASLGVSVKSASGLFAKMYVGPALITQTDSRLGSIFEFNIDLEAGLYDYRGIQFGADYKHMSNAGLFPNNIGRDMFLLKMQFPW